MSFRRVASTAALGVLVTLAGGNAWAVTCNWNSVGANWGTAANWTCTAGGTNHVPIAGDLVTFGPTDGNCTINVDPNNLASITILSTYSGTISQSGSRYLTVGAFSQASGTVNAWAELFDTGDFTLTGGTYNAPTALYVQGTFSNAGATFTPGSSTQSVLLLSDGASHTHTVTGTTFNNLAVSDGLLGYWKLDESSGTIADDYSGFANQLSQTSAKTAVTGTSLQFKNPYGSTFSVGTANPLNFDYGTGAGDTVPSYFQVSTWTVSAWVKATDVTGSGCGGTGTGNGSQVFDVGDDIGIRICAANSNASTATYARVYMNQTGSSSSTDCVSTNTFAMDDNTWHHIAGSYDGTTLTIYLDNTKTACSKSVTQEFGSYSAVTIGSHSNLTGYAWGGSIDDVRFYNRALTSGQIEILYRGGQPAVSTYTNTLSTTDTAIDVNKDLIIASGALATSTKNITVGGSWLNHGGVFTGTGTVTIDGASGGSIGANYQPFGALTINGTGSWSVLDRMWVDGVLTITAGTLATNSYVIHAATLSKADGAGAVFTPGTGTLVLDPSTPRILTVDSALRNLRVEDSTETGLVGYWKFDTAVGTIVRDRSGSGNTGTLNGNGNWSTVVPSRITFDNAGSMNFDGSTSYVALGTTSIPNPNATQSVAMWIYYTALPASGRTLYENLDGSSYGYRFGFGSSNKLQLWNAKASSAAVFQLDMSNTTTYPLSAWYHIAYTYDSGTGYYRLYLNGAEQANNNTATPTSGSTTSVRIANRNTGAEYWDGNIDDVRVYNVALSASEVLALYNGSYPARGGTTTVTLQANTTAAITGTTTVDSGATQTVYRAYEDQGGTAEGYPATAFDWSNYTYHATYAAFNAVVGAVTSGRIYKRDTYGVAQGYFALASGRSFVGAPKWTHDAVANSAVYYIYAIDDQGTVYKLNDASFTSSGGVVVTTYRNGASATATSPLAADTTNLYWTGLAADGATSTVFRLQQSNMTTVSSTATTTVINGAVPALATVNSSDYIFFANTSKLYKVAVSPSLGSLSSSSWAPSAAVYGRVTVQDGVVYFIDSLGKLFASDPSDLSSTWTYQDTGTHACTSTTCAAKNLFLNNKALNANGNAIWGDYDGHIYSVNTTTHAALTGYPWRPGTSADIFETAPLYRAGVVVIGSKIGKVYVVDHRTVSAGTPALTASYDFCTSATCTSGSAINSVGYDFDGGQYVVGTADGKMFYISASTDPTNSYN
jgi:hypothetical protein